MEAKNADLSALRINRGGETGAPATDRRRWLVIGLIAIGVIALVAALMRMGAPIGTPVPVHLTPATMLSQV